MLAVLFLILNKMFFFELEDNDIKIDKNVLEQIMLFVLYFGSHDRFIFFVNMYETLGRPPLQSSFD